LHRLKYRPFRSPNCIRRLTKNPPLPRDGTMARGTTLIRPPRKAHSERDNGRDPADVAR
jgi:hypothetical protein